MAKKFIDSSLLDKAIIFATNAHKNVERKGKNFPYIVHPLEAVSIVATITSDQELLAAAVLHDVVEDTDFTEEDIEKEFGKRVARLVATESDIVMNNVSKEESWKTRKTEMLDRLKKADLDSKTVAMGDKLSNMRAISRDYKAMGDDLWQIFHIKDPKEHGWYYRGLANSLSELSDTSAYKEFVSLIEEVFGK